MPSSRRQFQIALTGLFAALAFVLGRIPRPPNVELVTFALFSAGHVGGLQVGLVSGLLLSVLQLTFGGGGGPFLAAAQLVGFGTIGAAGSLLAGRVPRPGVLALAGAVLTIWYQLLVNLALVPGSGLTLTQVLVPGAPFAALHVVSNMVVFEIGRALLLTVERHPAIAGYRKSVISQPQDARS